MAEERPCPTCGDFDLVLTPDEPIDGWNELACKSCHRVLEIGRPGIGPLVDPLWVDRSQKASTARVPRIEQLEADLKACADRLEENTATMNTARARIERLEAALWKIVGLGENTQRAIPIAVAALAPEQDK